MNLYDITTNWSRSFYERHTTLCEFFSMVAMLAGFITVFMLAIYQF